MNWYLVDGNYIDYLKSFDNKVGNVNYGSAIKPYIGVVFKMNGTNYYVPISSAKPKHNTMSNSVDFLKIESEGRLLAVINLNNMIPVPDACLTEIKYNTIANYRRFNSNDEKVDYIYLLQLEKKFIDAYEERIINNANKLYSKCKQFPDSNLARRCCNFALLEEKCKEWE